VSDDAGQGERSLSTDLILNSSLNLEVIQMKKDDRVRHNAAPHWGVGKVLEDPISRKIRIFFTNAGERLIALPADIRVVTGKEASSSLLDNLSIASIDKKGTFKSLMELRTRFLDKFSGGFHGPKYIKVERNYKDEAHRLASELLDKRKFDATFRSGEYAELCDAAKSVVSKTNLIFPNEKMNFTDGLKTQRHQKEFVRRLFELLYGEESHQQRFMSLCEVLEDMGAAKWTVATYFPFLRYPSDFMFMKPLVTLRAAEVCGFDLNYKPALNWLTYSKLLEFSIYLMSELADLRPRDMIDVQSFIWCTGEGRE
jgi:hypothetical protein